MSVVASRVRPDRSQPALLSTERRIAEIGTESMGGDNPQDDTQARTLTRIARTLGVPIETLLASEPHAMPGFETLDVGGDDPAQVMALLRLFVRLKSPEARARCFAYVVQEATRDD